MKAPTGKIGGVRWALGFSGDSTEYNHIFLEPVTEAKEMDSFDWFQSFSPGEARLVIKLLQAALKALDKKEEK